MKREKVHFFVAFLFILILALSSYVKFFYLNRNNTQIVKIGVILPLTGELGNFGKTVLNGIYMSINNFKSKNKKIEIDLRIEDSQGVPAVSVSAMHKLIDIDKTRIIIGDLTSSSTLAIAPIANQTETLLMSPTASNPSLSSSGKFFFRVWTSDSFDGMVAANYIFNTMKIKNVGIFYLNNDYGVGLKDVFEKRFNKLGGTISITEGYQDNQLDFRTSLIKLKKMNIGVLYLPGQPQGIATILRQAKELGVNIKMFSCVAAEDKEFIKIAGDSAVGLTFTAPAFDISSQDKHIKQFVETYEINYSEKPDTHAVHGYDAMDTILNAIESGFDDPSRMSNYFHQRHKYNGVSGEFSFDANGDVVTSVAIKQYSDNYVIKTVEVVKP